MTFSTSCIRCVAIGSVLAAAWIVAGAQAEEDSAKTATVAILPDSSPADTATERKDDLMAKTLSADGVDAQQLQDVIQFARKALDQIDREIQDYTCIVVKRERTNGRLHTHQYFLAKIRHARTTDEGEEIPFSVFLRFLKPEAVAGREVLFVEGRHHGDLIARRGGRRSPNMTLQLDPAGPLAMEGNRYPITEIGMRNLTRRLIEVMEEEASSTDRAVKIFRDAKLNGRKCIHFELRHQDRSVESRFCKADVLVDMELKIPVYYAAYDWPRQEGGAPRLLEEYIYTKVKLNVGLTDEDFATTNPNYHFTPLDDEPKEGE